jgi:LmbE family N-acetylglucosaminyl deacetylase
MLARLRRLTVGAMRLCAVDQTGASAARSALVLAPHPDDETLGCGATILRKVAAGATVTVVVLTDGRHSHQSEHVSPAELAALRRTEMAEAATRLGLDPDLIRWGGFVDGTLTAREDEVSTLVGKLLAELAPDEVYCTFVEDPHPDHAALGRATRRAVQAADGGHTLLEYPVWLWGSWPFRRGDRVRSTVEAGRLVLFRRVSRVRTGAHLAGKLHALQAHASQLGRPEAVPPTAPWATLPRTVLAMAAGPYELFLHQR